MSEVQLVESNGKFYLKAPYNEDLPYEAKKLGGRWDPDRKAWRFDPRDRDRVSALAKSIYGTDGTDSPELVTVRLSLSAYADDRTATIAGRIVVNRPGRDDELRLGDGVTIVSGSYHGGSGSVRYPVIGKNDIVIEVRDVPRPLAEADGLEIIEQGVSVEQLQAERARLMARVTEIDSALAAA